MNKIIVDTQQYNNSQITKPKSGNFSTIIRIHNFITFKNNNFSIKGAVFKKVCKTGWDQIMIDKNMLVIPTNIQNSTKIITNTLMQHSISNESEDLTQTNGDGLNLYKKYCFKPDLIKPKEIIKEGLKFFKFRFETSHKSVTSTCAYRSHRIISAGGSI